MFDWKLIRSVYREEGLRGIWIRILGRTVYRRLLIMERLLAEPDPVLPADPGIGIGELDSGAEEDYRVFRSGANTDTFRTRLQRGHQCFAAWETSHLVSVCWAATRRPWIDYLQREFPLHPGEVYIYDSFTAPVARGRNVAATRGIYMIRHFREAGFDRLIALVLPENRPAISPLMKLGYRPSGVVRRWKLGPLRLDRIRRSCSSDGSHSILRGVTNGGSPSGANFTSGT